MKTKLLLFFTCLLLISCKQIKEHQMEKDAEKLIETSQNSKGFSSLATIDIFFKSIQNKYQGEEMLEFMSILRKKVLEKKAKGEDCGAVEILYLFDKEFNALDENTTNDNVKSQTENKKQDKAKTQAETARRKDEERKRKEEEQMRQQSISNQVAGAFGAESSKQEKIKTPNISNTIETQQFHSNGDSPIPGRSLIDALSRPKSSVQEEGQILINVTIDKNGDVISATIANGTNISNSDMRKAALEAAKKAKFNSISEDENQSGTITYKYSLK